MEYRSLNVNEFNNLNQTVVADTAGVELGMLNYEHFIRRGKTERARMTLAALKQVRDRIAGVFA